MQELTYFNIGFRCENVYQQILNYKMGKDYNPSVIEDSKKILLDCVPIAGHSLSGLSSINECEMNNIIPLIFEVFNDLPLEGIIEKLVTIKDLIGELMRGQEGVDVTTAEIFFNRLSELCLNKNNLLNNSSRLFQ